MRRKNYDTLIFLLVTFGLSLIFGFYFYLNKKDFNPNFLISFMMLFPAIGFATSQIITNKSLNLPYKIFTIHFAMLLFYIIYIYLAKNRIIEESYGSQIISIAVLVGSLLIFLVDKAKLSINNLELNKNLKKSIKYILLFIVLLVVSNLIKYHNIEYSKALLKNSFVILISPLFVFLTFINYFAQELGWRNFLQGKLQNKFGLRLGTIVLGLIWGIFYSIPTIFLDDNSIIFYNIIEKIINCIFISIYFSYVYLKIKNIWVIALLHGLYNQINSTLFNPIASNLNVESNLVFLIISMAIVFLPFFFTNVYKKEEYEEEWFWKNTNIL